MNTPSEKEKLLSMLTKIYNQLEELDLILDASFSDLRNSLEKEVLERVIVPKQRIEAAEKGIENIQSFYLREADSSRQPLAGVLKLELGF